jgi:hypothetical protein
LVIGTLYVFIFSAAWRWLGEYQQIRLAPMAVLLIADVGWLGYRLLAGAVAVASGLKRRQPDGLGSEASTPELRIVLLVVLSIVMKFTLLLSLPIGALPWPADWRQHLGFLYPLVIYRPLVLMPLWGRWSVLLATTIGRMSSGDSERLSLMAEGKSLPAVMLWWAAISGLTAIYCSPAGSHIAWSLLISLGMLLVAYLVSFGLARRLGGQTEASVMAAGWAVEFAFLLFYLPVARSIYWY